MNGIENLNVNLNVNEIENGNVSVNVNLNINRNDNELVDVNVNDIEGDRTEEENENQSQSVSKKGKKNGNKNDANGSEIDEDEEKRMIEETPTHPSFTLRAQSVPQLNQHQQPSLSPRAESQPRTFSIGPPIDNNTNGRKRKREESKARSIGILSSSIASSVRSPSNPSTQTKNEGESVGIVV